MGDCEKVKGRCGLHVEDIASSLREPSFFAERSASRSALAYEAPQEFLPFHIVS